MVMQSVRGMAMHACTVMHAHDLGGLGPSLSGIAAGAHALHMRAHVGMYARVRAH